MAKPLKANGKGKGNGSGQPPAGGPTRGHNLAQINATILKGFREIYDCEQEITLLMEKHIDELKEHRTKLWRDLKADTNVRRKVLTTEYKRYALAREMAEAEEGNEVLDEMKIVHEALHPGETVNWLDVVKRVNAGIVAVA